MGLFDKQAAQVIGFLQNEEQKGSAVRLNLQGRDWPRGSSLVLEEDTRLELGHPSKGSLSFMGWTADEFEPRAAAFLIGPDMPDIRQPSSPFGQLILISGRFDREYECWRDLKQAVLDAKLEGLMSRAMPSRNEIWLRANQQAIERGLSLEHLASALVQEIMELDFVSGVRVIFITSGKDDLEKVAEPAREAERIAAAMMKMEEEMTYDCESCEYADVCDEVTELKRIRKKLQEGAG